MKKTLLASLLTMTLASQAEAACLTLNDRYSGVIPANSTVTAYGPITLVNGPGCRFISISASVRSAEGGSAPTMWIETFEDGLWKKVADAPGGSVSFIATVGTYQVRHRNDYSVPRVYSGSTAITR